MVLVEGMEEEDFEILNNMIQKHAKFTKSEVANHILENWKIEKNHFAKVMPIDYKAVLQTHKKVETKAAEVFAEVDAA
jgi:glutamate synthase domain-containing protein 3